MQTAVRIFTTLIAAVAAMYLGAFVAGALLGALHLPAWLITLVSLVLAVSVARFVWLRLASPHAGLARSIALGALITGGIGFSAGFFGPLLLRPEANQGPLLGILITGPLGVLLGAIAGGLLWRMRANRHRPLPDDDSA